MKPARLYRGDTWKRAWIAKDSTGAVIDLTGATARLHVRDSGGTLVLNYTQADALTITELSGRIDLEAPYADMEGLAPGTYSFDLEVTLAGVRRTYEVNTLVISADVSYGS